MKLREKVLKALRDENTSVSGIAEEILTSPKEVLEALEYLTDAGVLPGAKKASYVEPIRKQRIEMIKRILREDTNALRCI